MLFSAFILHILTETDDVEFANLVAECGCLWPAFTSRWRDEQEVGELDAIRAIPQVPSGLPTRDAAYFIRQGWEILFHCKELGGEEGLVNTVCLWERLALIKSMWGIPFSASANCDDIHALVLARICEVVYYNKISTLDFDGTQYLNHFLSVHAGIGLCHSCYPTAHVRFEDFVGAVVGDKAVQAGGVRHCGHPDRRGDCDFICRRYFWDRQRFHFVLQIQYGFQCRDCPRCRDPTHSPMLLDHELFNRGKPAHLVDQLRSLETTMVIESKLAMEGKTHGGGMLHSMSLCFSFSYSVPALQTWLSEAEGNFPSLGKELRDARVQLAFCFYARQQHTEALVL